jgi:hypothetical protein
MFKQVVLTYRSNGERHSGMVVDYGDEHLVIQADATAAHLIKNAALELDTRFDNREWDFEILDLPATHVSLKTQ